MLALPLETGPICSKLNQAAFVGIRDITRTSVGAAEGQIRRFRTEDVDFAEQFSAGETTATVPFP